METVSNSFSNKASWFRLFKFILIKITHSFIAVFLLLLSLFVTIVINIVLLLLDLEPNYLLKSFVFISKKLY